MLTRFKRGLTITWLITTFLKFACYVGERHIYAYLTVEAMHKAILDESHPFPWPMLLAPLFGGILHVVSVCTR